MVDNSISNFRMNSKNANANDGGSNSKSNEAESSDFGSILGKARQGQQEAPTAKSSSTKPASARAAATKLDKPKVGSRDPFFPATPVPYHPDASVAQAPREPARDSAGQRGESVESLPTDEVRSKADVGISRAKLDHRASSQGINVPNDAHPILGKKSVDAVEGDLNDEDGVLSESYEGAVVSYPVSRIAQESLDDDTKADLQAQGLWNLPTTVMAQPTAKMAAMSEAAQNAKNVKGIGMRESSVPVQKPIAQFMASLENDLGVSPDRLVQAFQKLPPGQMALPPEQTMVQVIKNLGLSKDETATAMSAYSKMLAQMQMLDRPERMQAAPLVMGGLTTSKVEQQIEAAGFVKPEAKNVAGKYAMQMPEQMVKAEGKSGVVQDAQGADLQSGRRAESQGYEGLKAAGMNSQKAGAEDASASFGNQIGMKNLEVKGQSQNNFDSQGQSLSQNSGDQGQSPNGSANGSAGSAAVFAASQVGEGKAANAKEQVSFDVKRDLGVKETSVKSTSASVTGDTVNVNSGSQVQAESKPLQNVGAPAAAGAAVGAKGAAAELKNENQARHDAIQHIVSNAQLLAQKGGGEMKLTLKPDHMGEIQLRVAMEGNKVNVQMTAEKSEVKKLIEQNIHELRSGLAQHNFSMEKLDVSIANKDAGNQFQGKQPDFGAAQDFFNSFHQQQGNRRQMMAGLSEMSSPAMRKSSGSAGLQASGFSGSGSVRAMGSSRLNVVA